MIEDFHQLGEIKKKIIFEVENRGRTVSFKEGKYALLFKLW